METVLALGVLLGLVGILVGLIHPRAFGMTRGKAVLASSAFTVVCFGLFGSQLPPREPPASTEQPARAAASPAAPPPSGLTVVAPAPPPPPAPVSPPPAPRREPRGPDTLRSPGSANSVLVWRDGNKMNEGIRLIQAGVNRTQPQLLMPLLACIVPNDTRIVVTDGGFFSSTVMVVDGQQTGCRGVVENEQIARTN